MKIIMIAAMGMDRCIGIGGKIPWHIPEDLRQFRLLTQGHVVIMGRRTWESIGKPLPNRVNIVMTTRSMPPVEGVTFVSGVVQAIEAAAAVEGVTDVYIIGGHDIYRAFMPLADTMYINHVQLRTTGGDTYFPMINPLQWYRVPWDGLVSAEIPSQWMLYNKTKKEK